MKQQLISPHFSLKMIKGRAFTGGRAILNVLKEELPEERESRFQAFLLGASAYALLLLTL